MAVAYTAAGTLKTQATGNLTTVGIPAAFAADDIHVCVLCSADNVSATFPAGWTKKVEVNSGSFCRVTVAYRRAVAGDTTFTITRAAGGSAAARVFGFRGCVASGDPFDDAQIQANTATLTVTAPTASTLSANDMVIFASGAVNHSSPADTSSTYIYATPSGSNPGWTKRSADTDGSGLDADYAGLGLFSGLKTDIGAVGARTSALSGGYLAANTLNAGAILTLIAASSAPGLPYQFNPVPFMSNGRI